MSSGTCPLLWGLSGNSWQPRAWVLRSCMPCSWDTSTGIHSMKECQSWEYPSQKLGTGSTLSLQYKPGFENFPEERKQKRHCVTSCLSWTWLWDSDDKTSFTWIWASIHFTCNAHNYPHTHQKKGKKFRINWPQVSSALKHLVKANTNHF